MAKNLLKAWLADNTVTTDDKTDKILLLESTRSVDQEFVLDRMAALNPGVHRETMTLSVRLFQQVLMDLALNGYSVSTDIMHLVPQFRGVVKNNAWDTDVNSIYISFTQGKKLREAIQDTTVQILGEKPGNFYIAGTRNVATRATDLSATAGRNFSLYGKNLTVVGTDPAVGVSIKSVESGTVTKLPADMIVVNKPSELNILIPAGLKDGEYELTVTTQFANAGKLLKTPRSTTQTIYIGTAPTGGDSRNTGGGTPGDENDNPLG